MSDLPDIKSWINLNPTGKHSAGKTTFLKYVAQLCKSARWFDSVDDLLSTDITGMVCLMYNSNEQCLRLIIEKVQVQSCLVFVAVQYIPDPRHYNFADCLIFLKPDSRMIEHSYLQWDKAFMVFDPWAGHTQWVLRTGLE